MWINGSLSVAARLYSKYFLCTTPDSPSYLYITKAKTKISQEYCDSMKCKSAVEMTFAEYWDSVLILGACCF